jgi:hypothetical protein
MRILIWLIVTCVVGFLGLIVIDTGPLRGIAVLMFIVPPFLIALAFGNYFMNRQLHKHVRGK